MFLKETKSILAAGLEQIFSPSYPQEDFQGLFVSIEYPLQEQNYPAVWVGFEPLGTIDRAGIDGSFGNTVMGADGLPSVNCLWRATGYGTFTLGAMTSLQRDRLFDELVRVFAFNAEPPVKSFRNLIEANELIAINMNFDNIAVRSLTENPGTPWGTSDIIYESTLAIEAQIEFASDNSGLTPTLIPLHSITVTATDSVDSLTLPSQTIPEPWM